MPTDTPEPLTLDGSTVPEPPPSYGAGERHEAAKLFEPEPAPMPGQSFMDV